MDRKTTETFIRENFGGIIQDWPWEDTPEYTVFRHVDNRKWFALIMRVKYATIIPQGSVASPELDPDKPLDIINLKADPDLIETLLREATIFPAYHMNKRHWVTLPLDGSCHADQIKALIDLSYRLTTRKAR